MFYPRRLLLVLAGVALLYPPLVHAQTEEWTVYASVVDRAGAPVHGLDAPDFVVRENGMAREILRVAPAADSIRIALLIDTSQEMRSELIDVRQSLRTFVNEIDRRHEVALVGFGGPPSVLVDYTKDVKRLEGGIGRLVARPGTGSYLLSAIIDTSHAAKTADLRRVMVIVTTQGPEFSEIASDRARYVRDSGTHALVRAQTRRGRQPTRQRRKSS
jgi:hypothetical protein